MKFFDDILQSVSGNTKTKVEDPFIGAFLGSWIICNWSNLAILIWGDGSAAERIKALNEYFNSADWVGWNTVFVIPMCMALLFLFAFPWVSLFLKSLQRFANERLHQQAISIEVGKVKQQEKLNKQKLVADPEKRFLEQNVQLDIDHRKEVIEQLKLRGVKRKEQAEAAAAASEAALASMAEAKSRASIAKLEEEKKQNSSLLDRQRFDVASARLKSAQASSRFPSAYSFMLAIEESLKADDVKLSLDGLGETVAMVFGYENFHSLIHDESFNNEKLSEVVFIYYDPNEFAAALEAIVQDEVSASENLESGLLFDHVMSVFDGLDYRLITEEQVEEVCRDVCDGFKYDLLNSDGFSGPIAESDTVFDEIEIDELESVVFDNGLSVSFTGSASGSHRKDEGVPGRDIGFSIELTNTVLLGKRALSKFEVGEVSAKLIDYDYDGEEDFSAN